MRRIEIPPENRKHGNTEIPHDLVLKDVYSMKKPSDQKYKQK